jgi:hypothetical protein
MQAHAATQRRQHDGAPHDARSFTLCAPSVPSPPGGAGPVCRAPRVVCQRRSSLPVLVLLPVAGVLSLSLHAAHTMASSSSSSTGTALVSSSSTGDWNSSSSSSGVDVLVLGPMSVAYLCEAIIWGILTLVWLFFFSATLLALRFSPKKKVATAKLVRTHAAAASGLGSAGKPFCCWTISSLMLLHISCLSVVRM